MRRRLFLTYLSLMFVPVLLFLCTSYWIVRGREMDKLEYACQAALEATVSSVHSVFESMQALSQTLANATWVQKVAYMQSSEIDASRFDAMERYQSVKTLQSNMHAANAALVAVVFPQKNYAISSHYIHSLDAFMDTDVPFSCVASEDWRALMGSSGRSGISEPGTLTFLSYIRQCVGYVATIPFPNTSRTSANLVAYFDLKVIESRMHAAILDGGAHLLAETPHGGIIWAAADSHGARFDPGQGGWGLWNGERALQVEKKSALTGWIFRVFLPESVIAARLFPLRAALYALMLAFALLAVGCAWILAKRQSAPLLRLKQLLGAPEPLPSKRNMYDVLESALEGILEERNKQNRLLRMYRPRLREYYLRRLLEEAEAPHEENLALAGIVFPFPNTRCLVVGPPGEAARSLAGMLCNLAVQADLAEYDLCYRGDEVLILNYADSQSFEGFKALARDALQASGPWVGVGSVGDIRQSYAQARQALERRTGASHWLEYEQAQSSTPHLAPGLESHLLNCVKSGENQQAEDIVVRALTGEGAMPVPSLADAKFICLNVCFILSRALTEMGMPALHAVRLEAFQEKQSLAALLEWIRPMLQEACDRCAQATAERGPSERHAEIERYIQEHLSDSALSLTALAEHFGMSGSYISRLIKANRQMSYLDYLNRLRIDKAKQLLKSTNRDINAISALVGYDNDITFRRVFKKLETITPSQYRAVARINHPDAEG